MSHVPGQTLIRQLALDEPLSPEDLCPPNWRFAPTGLHEKGANTPAGADINPGSISPPKRSALGSVSVPYSIPGVGHDDTFLSTFGLHHDLGFKPLAVVDTGNIAVIC